MKMSDTKKNVKQNGERETFLNISQNIHMFVGLLIGPQPPGLKPEMPGQVRQLPSFLGGSSSDNYLMIS